MSETNRSEWKLSASGNERNIPAKAIGNDGYAATEREGDRMTERRE